MPFTMVVASGGSNSSNDSTPDINTGSPGAGDLTIFICCFDNTALPVTSFGNWTELLVLGAPADAIAAGYAFGALAATEAITLTNAKRWSATYWKSTAGHHASTPPVITSSEGGSSTSPDPAAITPAGGSDAYRILVGITKQTGTSTSIDGMPAGYTAQAELDSGGSGSVHNRHRTAYLDIDAASEDPGVGSISSAEFWTTVTIAVYPAAASAAGPGTLVRPSLHESMLINSKLLR